MLAVSALTLPVVLASTAHNNTGPPGDDHSSSRAVPWGRLEGCRDSARLHRDTVLAVYNNRSAGYWEIGSIFRQKDGGHRSTGDDQPSGQRGFTRLPLSVNKMQACQASGGC